MMRRQAFFEKVLTRPRSADTIKANSEKTEQRPSVRNVPFVSDVLRQVIENGGTRPTAGGKPKKPPLEIPMEKREKFAYSEKPIPASEIAYALKRNTSAVRSRLKKLGFNA